MGWFKKKDEDHWNEIHTYLKNSFSNVKQDTSNIFDWLQFLYQKSMQQEQLINQLQYQLNQTPNSPEAIKQLIDAHYSYSRVHSKIQDLNQKMALLSQLHDSHNTQINQLSQKFQEAPKPKQPNIKERIIQKLTSNSKNYVKTVLLSFIEKYHKISALQLKEMLVDEQKICSKSSFYRLLQELEGENRVELLSDGKNKLYMAKNPYIHQ
ncbi:MAG: hypothetical protein KAT77_05930 [Nanoarchaeota archaeon]|nr:hypothetical protein [Nanoarchaeota archaeon]